MAPWSISIDTQCGQVWSVILGLTLSGSRSSKLPPLSSHCRSTSRFVCLFVCYRYKTDVPTYSATDWYSDCVILRNNCYPVDWCLASPPARGDCEQHQVWWHNLRSPTLIWHNPSLEAPHRQYHHSFWHCTPDWLTDWLTDIAGQRARVVTCYRKLNQVILAGPGWTTDGPWNSLLKSNQPAREPITDVWQNRAQYYNTIHRQHRNLQIHIGSGFKTETCWSQSSSVHLPVSCMFAGVGR